MNSINFDVLPNHSSSNNQQNNRTDVPIPPVSWNILDKPIFTRQCVKTGHFGKNQTRIIFPKPLVDSINLTKDFNAYFILYRAEQKLIIMLSKNNISDADFKRAVGPIGTGSYFTVVPPKILRYMGMTTFPDYIWIIKSDKSTPEDTILEIWPGSNKE
jgi:hypothetical protein